MRRDANLPICELKVDGGASRNNLMMQFQSDVLNVPVFRPRVTETTALGAAYLAGLAVGYWSSIDEIKRQWQVENEFKPQGDLEKVKAIVNKWHDAINRTLSNRKQ